MKLSPKEFKRFKELSAKQKAGKCSTQEEIELADLTAKRNDKGSNDIQWWKNYPDLLKDVTNVAFNYIPGTNVAITGFNNTSGLLNLGVIAKAILRPAIGKSVSDADAFNAQIRQLWLDMHRKYRGIGTYEKSDLGVAILAIDGLFETLAKFERIYGVINTYHIGNRVVPYGLKEALGISADLEENLADFRYTLNLFIAKIQQLCLPKGMSVLTSDIVALGNIFKDSANRRASMFFYDQDLYALYLPSTFTTGGSVGYAPYSNHMTGTTTGARPAFTLADITAILNAQCSQLLNDDDIARICSDLLAAYGPENVLTLVSMPEDYRVEPVEDYERQIQFHNLTVCHGAGTIFFGISDISTAADANTLATNYPIIIYQTNNTVMCRLGQCDGTPNYVSTSDGFHPTFGSTSSHYGKENEIILDTFVESPGEVEIMCGTRYSALVAPRVTVTSNVYRGEIDVFGTKVCSALYMYSYANNTYYSFDINGSVVSVASFATANLAFGFFKTQQIDWFPTIYVRDSSDAVQVFGDVDNFAVINRANLGRLHEVALLSGYKIPMVSKE